MARAGSPASRPKKLTLSQVQKSLRGKALTAWKAATPDERRQVVEMLNEEAVRKAEEARREQARRETEAVNDRFWKTFWEPVRREQARAKRKRE